MKQNALWFLENIDLHGVFCPQKLGHSSHEEHFTKKVKKGDFIYVPEEKADCIFFIAEGQIKIGTYHDGGKEITKAILEKGEVFGELVLLDEDRRRDFAVATEASELCIIKKEDISSLMKEHSNIGLFFMKVFGNRALKMEKRIESLVFKDARTRIVDFLRELAKTKGKPAGFEIVVRKFITHQEIANITATSRQTVTTVLNELRNKNIITFNRRNLLVRDIDLLK